MFAVLAVAILDAGLLVAQGETNKKQLPAGFAADQLEKIKHSMAGAWAIGLDIDMPELDPQALQYTVLNHDPASKYLAEVKRMRAINRQMLAEAKTKLDKAEARNAQLMVDWDSGFKDVTGDNLWLLAKRCGNQSATAVLSSNSPPGKKWIVTKTVRAGEKVVCWSIPVELKAGKKIFVMLNESNVFDLNGPYDEAMRETR